MFKVSIRHHGVIEVFTVGSMMQVEALKICAIETGSFEIVHHEPLQPMNVQEIIRIVLTRDNE